ncbi:hypothetical protein [Nonomuraea insulae]|uniref:Transcriptional regulator n=1 Tax=Nonomuraea insulae TaxID=1616787 RepID=A0ABW1D646_9ACTN
MRLLDAAQGIVEQASHSYGAALMKITRAKALSLVERHAEATRLLDEARDTLGTGRLPVSIMPAYWGTQRLPYAETCVYAAVGEEKKANEARERLSQDDYQYPTNARLMLAMCTVVRGGVDQGMKGAAEVLGSLPEEHRTNMIKHTARLVLRAVPMDQRDRSAVRDVRSLLAIEV